MPLELGDAGLPKPEDHSVHLVAAISMLNQQWDLRLPVPKGDDSPSQRQRSDEGRLVFYMKFLQYRGLLPSAKSEFERQAEILYTKWVHKPRAERGTLPPRTRDRARVVSDPERDQLLQLALKIFGDEYRNTPKTPSQMSRKNEGLNDAAIKSNLPKSNRKRTSGDQFEDIDTSSKKQKQPQLRKKSQERRTMPPPSPPRRLTSSRMLDADVSFTSTTSGASIFTNPTLRHQESTQLTIFDDESEVPTQPNSRPLSPTVCPPSSDYGSSSFDQHIKDSFDAGHMVDVDVEESFEDRLTSIFGVSIGDLEFFEHLEEDNYESFWNRIQDHALFRGKELPKKCKPDVWEAAKVDYSFETKAVVFSGAVSYTNTTDPSAPYLRLRLEPMRFDSSYRLGRRFGHDRFLEIDFPPLFGKKVPKKNISPDQLVSWLVDAKHSLFGRSWKPFHVKPNDRRGRRWDSRNDDEFDSAHRVFFYAVDGQGFTDALNPLQDNPYALARMSVGDMLDLARSIDLNKDQPYLKLFARTDLLTSKNTPTVALSYNEDPTRSQIIYKDDIICQDAESGREEVMTDGAGQISPELARSITNSLGLTFIPSGFQGRIGEAKGFWSVDYRDRSGKEWITIYASQRKWETNLEHSRDENSLHESHRTFEFLRSSAGLKSADLNLQFHPLLIDRASNAKAMELALKEILRKGLRRVLDELQDVISNPLAFRGWLSKSRSSNSERIKHGQVPYRAGLPTVIDERLILLLDAGFDPCKHFYPRELARKGFKAMHDELEKRLNITVSKSTYCYMVPDFTGVLEPDEIYLDFSSFSDDSADVSSSNILHNGMELLVARSPAHYPSDIQKVKAVHKVELVGLKDLIVFSTKGFPSLAAKLSGGDYDGDLAWVCWEPSIVDLFETAEMPKIPDLVREGIIKKDSRSYSEIVEGKRDPTSAFLKEAFLFNMQTKMLGRCTNHKEKFCYTMGTVSSNEAILFSTLLSCLVDQSKQGYVFTQEDWNGFLTKFIKRPVKIPKYMSDDFDPNSNHIIDVMMAAVKRMTTESLAEFERNMPTPPKWVPELVKYYDWARDKAKSNDEWKRLLDDLDSDLNEMNKEFRRSASNALHKDDDNNEGFLSRVDTTFERFRNIRPHFESSLTQSLLPDCFHEDDCDWALLRASGFWHTARGNRCPSAYHWNLAGIYLARLKTKFCTAGPAHYVTPPMYACLKPNNTYIKRLRSQAERRSDVVEESASVVNAEELDYIED